MANAGVAISPADVLAMLPRGLRFRFLDEIVEVDAAHVVARYQFREDEFFYPGHFPERAVTPGTILLEAMCQCGIAAHSYYLLAQEMPIEAAQEHRIFFTSAAVEWFEPVGPRDVVTIYSELLAWRRKRIRARVKLFGKLHCLAAEAQLSGFGMLLSPSAGKESDMESKDPLGGYRHESE